MDEEDPENLHNSSRDSMKSSEYRATYQFMEYILSVHSIKQMNKSANIINPRHDLGSINVS
jgi:hypothetical protein